ncbi:MAG: hypothetical protein U0350_31690 [Caldilineaceae bacterium]
MSMPFTRSLRSLENDHFQRASLLVLLIAVLLAVWAGWLLAARLPVYAVSDGVRVEKTTNAPSVKIVAAFAPNIALGRIQVGQTAYIRFNSVAWLQAGAIPATVANVALAEQTNQVQVTFTSLAQPSGQPALLPGLTGSAEIEVERISPARLLLRAAGYSVNP